MSITLTDLDAMLEKRSYKGFGYLGHICRTRKLDLLVIQELNQMGLDANESFLFLNSRAGRFMGDELESLIDDSEIVEKIRKHLTKEVPALKKEIQENN
jgi:hypothetical protein